jgi:uncharacterized protein (TIGR03382 family)
MKSVIASLVAVAGIAAAASAEVNTLVDFKVSLDGVNFFDTVNATPGQTVQVRLAVTYVGTGNALGFASLVCQPTVSNWDNAGAADALTPFVNNGVGGNTTTPSGVISDSPDQYGRISPFGRTAITSTANRLFGHVHSAGSGGAPAGTWLRIAQAQVTSWVGGAGNTTGGSGVNLAQLANVGRTASDPAFNSSILAVSLFRFGIVISSDAGQDRTLTIDAPLAGFGNRSTATGERECYWWGDLNASSGDVRGVAVIDGATIVVPTPATLALLGLGGLVVGRRRR